MRIAHISPGAAGMICGTCMHNNTLAKALIRQGHDVVLTPIYTPIRTDEESVSIDRVFYGAINAYLQHSSPIFRHTPRLFDWLLDRPRLLKAVSRFSGSTEGSTLGPLTLSLVQGEHGPQKKELEKLVGWLRDELEPEIVHLSLSLFLGFAHRIKEELGVPIVCELQGEDIFFDDIEEPYRTRILETLHQRAVDIDAFIAPNNYYADLMRREIGFPAERMHVVPLGIEPDGFQGGGERGGDDEIVLGFFARVCPEKGFHQMVDAFRILAADLGRDRIRLRAAGYLKDLDRPFFEAQQRRLADWGLADRFEYMGEVDRQGKADFLAGLDVYALPAVYKEPKGLSVLEAMACGVPVVLPAHGGFPELIDDTDGGILVEPDSPLALAAGIRGLIDDRDRRSMLGANGRAAVLAKRNGDTMAQAMAALYTRVLHPRTAVDDQRLEEVAVAVG